MNLKHRVVALERHRDGGRFLYLTTRPNEPAEAALARKGIVPREADYILVHAGFENERESVEWNAGGARQEAGSRLTC